MKRRGRALQRRYGRSSGQHGETRYWAHLAGFKGPIPIWAPTLMRAYAKAGTTAAAYGTSVTVVTIGEHGS